MKTKLFLLGFLLFAISSFASFPVFVPEIVEIADPEKFKLDTLGFVLGILTLWLMPYSLLLLLVQKKNFRGSVAWGWLAGLVITLLIVILIILNPQTLLLY